MGFSTMSGPLRTGTVRYTTGTTAGSVANVGCVELTQSKAIGSSSSVPTAATYTIGWIPAGAQINAIDIDTLTAFTFTGGTTPAATITVGDGSTANKYVTTTTITSAGRASLATTGSYANWVNIGTSDVPIVVTLAFTGTPTSVDAGYIQATVRYTQHASDGAQAPTSQQN
jgi:hypothetical protein